MNLITVILDDGECVADAQHATNLILGLSEINQTIFALALVGQFGERDFESLRLTR